MRATLNRLFCLGCCATWLAGNAAAAASGGEDLLAAIRKGDTAQVALLLKAGAAPGGDGTGPAPIIVAASRGQLEAAKLLLAKGADPNARFKGSNDQTALMCAVNGGHLAVAELLLANRADLNAVDGMGDPAINGAVFNGDEKAVRFLLEHGANTRLVGHGDALDVAMRRGHQHLVDLIAGRSGRLLPLQPVQAALVQAVREGDLPKAEATFTDGGSPSALDATGRSLLSLAARLGREDMVKVLVRRGAKLEAEDPIGFTALMEASRDGHTSTVAALLDLGANPNHAAKDRGLRMTALHLAAAHGKVEIIRLLVARKAAIDALDSEQATPLFWALFEHPAAAKLLAELGANPDIPDQAGETPRRAAEQNKMADLLAAFQKPRQP